MAGIPFTTEENEYIYSRVEEAKSLGLDMKPVFINIAEEFPNRSWQSIQAKYYELRKKNNKKEKKTKTKQRKTSLDDGLNILNDMKKIIKERNYYKEKYEALIKELNEIRELIEPK